LTNLLCKAKKSTLKTTARQQELLRQNFFCAKSIYKCVMDDGFTVDGNEWQQQSYYESEDHLTTEDVKFGFQRKRHKRTSIFQSLSCSQQRSVHI
jgi:hypothetical protein